MKTISVDAMLDFIAAGGVLIDVRTPAEFAHAHIPGAVNVCLFDDDERAEIGTLYAQDGRQPAIRRGLDVVGPKMGSIVDAVRQAVPDGDTQVAVHCWRGGMRSSSVAWLLNFVGFDVLVLDGGYKSFRRWVLQRLEEIPALRVLGGRTGSGKTDVLIEMASRGEAVIDLEGLANHRGSSFGAVQLPPQPAQEQFEALLALALRDVGPGPVWIEDESRMIGSCKIPDALMNALRSSDVHVLHAPKDQRVAHLVEIYGDAQRDGLRVCFERIQKRLGGERTRDALNALDEGDLATAASIALDYYDRAYDYGLSKREQSSLRNHDVAVDPTQTAELLIQVVK